MDKRSWQKVLDELRVEAVTKTLDDSATQAWRLCNGWSLLLGRYENEDGVYWHFSAVLYPRGRLSTEKDRRWLGTMARYLGAPGEPTISPQEGEQQAGDSPPANQPVYWVWKEEKEEN